jgi:hypothetical protein
MVGNTTAISGFFSDAVARKNSMLTEEADTEVPPAAQGARVADLLAKAAQCRRLAAGVCDHEAARVLRAMADNYETGARIRS